MKKLAKLLTIEVLSALLTIVLVAATSLYFMAVGVQHQPLPMVFIAALLMLTFAGLFLFATRDQPFRHEPRTRLVLVGLQLVVIIAIYFIVPFTYVAIFGTIWSAQLPYFMSTKRAFLLSPLFALPIWIAFGWHWGVPNSWVSAILFWTFNLFATMTMATQLREARARQQVEQTNRELKATQALLTAATEQAERTRIARNIHDLLGHHLTALTIHLQVASRKTSGDAKQAVDRSHAIAKLLLADVREAVSDLRDADHIDIQQALQALALDSPHVQVQVSCDAALQLNDIQVAQAILRCAQESITNALRHGRASLINIELSQTPQQWQLVVQDNGKVANEWQPGNGLKGMQERARLITAQLCWQANDNGFRTTLKIPRSEAT